MTKSMVGRLAGAIVALAGLAYGPGTQLASAAKPTTFPAVPLVVTVEEFDSDANPCRICVDDPDLGAYENGIDGVTANLDQYGNVILNFNAEQSPIVRKLRFDYSNPVAAGNEFRPPAALNSYLSTQTHPLGPIQTMAIGTAQCIMSNITFTDTDPSRTMYRTHFRRPLAGIDLSHTSFLVVTRVDANTWELEPKAAACNSNATVAKLVSQPTKGHSTVTDRGDYFMAFKMTLVRQ